MSHRLRGDLSESQILLAGGGDRRRNRKSAWVSAMATGKRDAVCSAEWMVHWRCADVSLLNLDSVPGHKAIEKGLLKIRVHGGAGKLNNEQWVALSLNINWIKTPLWQWLLYPSPKSGVKIRRKFPHFYVQIPPTHTFGLNAPRSGSMCCVVLGVDCLVKNRGSFDLHVTLNKTSPFLFHWAQAVPARCG